MFPAAPNVRMYMPNASGLDGVYRYGSISCHRQNTNLHHMHAPCGPRMNTRTHVLHEIMRGVEEATYISLISPAASTSLLETRSNKVKTCPSARPCKSSSSMIPSWIANINNWLPTHATEVRQSSSSTTQPLGSTANVFCPKPFGALSHGIGLVKPNATCTDGDRSFRVENEQTLLYCSVSPRVTHDGNRHMMVIVTGTAFA